MLCTQSVPLLGRINLEFGTAVKLYSGPVDALSPRRKAC
jgi:hypothetical protein